MGDFKIDTRELEAFRKALKAVRPESPEWSREFARINQQAGNAIATDAAGRLRGRQGARAGSAIKGSRSTVGIRVAVSNTAGVPYALATVFGAKRHTGWYAHERYARSAGRQFPPWVGANWEVGGPGEGPGRGPYGLNPAIHDRVKEVMDDWADMVENLMTRFGNR